MIADPKRKPHQDADASDKRRRQEEALDDALKNTFPASDPVSVEQPTTSSRRRAGAPVVPDPSDSQGAIPRPRPTASRPWPRPPARRRAF